MITPPFIAYDTNLVSSSSRCTATILNLKSQIKVTIPQWPGISKCKITCEWRARLSLYHSHTGSEEKHGKFSISMRMSIFAHFQLNVVKCSNITILIIGLQRRFSMLILVVQRRFPMLTPGHKEQMYCHVYLSCFQSICEEAYEISAAMTKYFRV